MSEETNQTPAATPATPTPPTSLLGSAGDGGTKTGPEANANEGGQNAPDPKAIQNPNPDPKPDDKNPAGNAPKPDDEKKPDEKSVNAPPEKYEFKSPEGHTLDEAVLKSFAESAKEAGLSNDAAQKVIDKVAPVIAARQLESIVAVHKQWVEASTSDKEFGGAKLSESLATAKKAVEAFGTPELSRILNESGFGNHPEIIRFLFRTGRAIGVDKFVGGVSRPHESKDLADVLYGGTKEKD
jgi:hypothetical protein